MDVWASRAIVDIEAIHAVVKPYAEEVGPPEVSRDAKKARMRYAPPSVPGSDRLQQTKRMRKNG
jgi:hypothetical protein